MPLAPVSPTPVSFPDWQRVNNWDGPVAFRQLNVNSAGPIQTQVFDVSRFAYLGGFDTVSNADAFCDIKWYADQAATILVGERAVVLAAAINRPAQYRLPNLGPYCQITWSEFAGAHFLHNCVILPTNRFHPLEFIPRIGQLMTQQNTAVGSGVAATLTPFEYYAGPIVVWGQMPAANWFLTFFASDINNNPQYLDQYAASAAGNFRWTTVAPPGKWYATVFNNTINPGNYFLGVTPSMSGAL